MTLPRRISLGSEELARRAAFELEREIERRVQAGEDLEDLEVVVKQGQQLVENRRTRS